MVAAEDVRLGALPTGWTHVGEVEHGVFRGPDGVETENDPRLRSTHLKSRGVPMEVLELV